VLALRCRRADRLLDLALGPAVDVVRDGAVRDPARAEPLGGDDGQLVLLRDAEPVRRKEADSVRAVET